MNSQINDFIRRWKASGGSEQANAQLFLSELCDILELPRPEPAQPLNEQNSYSFERKVNVEWPEKRVKRLDLYKRGCFVLEAKQGQAEGAEAQKGESKSSAVRRGSPQWERTMAAARNQAEAYARYLPAEEGRPPFLIVADIGYCFDLYSEFSRSGGVYQPFPDAGAMRIHIDDLANEETRELLRNIWLDPLSLDPARKALQVTEDLAKKLGSLAKSLEQSGKDPDLVAQFLMRCLFTMFAEDMELIPRDSFKSLIREAQAKPEMYELLLRDLWTAMNNGEVCMSIRAKLLRFNGNLFAHPEILPLDRGQLALLLEAAEADWRHVEPAIFGTLLERALDATERHKLGAHYTPRAYVERLIMPAVIEPLRDEWQRANYAAALLDKNGKPDEALKTLAEFYDRLLKTRILDPACGSGNFLYVAMEHLKRLEGEVLKQLSAYDNYSPRLEEISPGQFLGIEVNPRAAHIAEMVLWIGYLQWHKRTRKNAAPPEPVIRKLNNITHGDAVLAWDKAEYAKDATGQPKTRWDGKTMKTDPATGREIPDESARAVDLVYKGARPAAWPKADYIIGNPPFVGNKRMRLVLGDGYARALREAYPDVPESCDFVMYWWRNAAQLAQDGAIIRFGFVTTNSITQVFNRKVLKKYLDAKKDSLGIVFAIPDHPWVDSADGAAVRIAMTVAEKGNKDGTLVTVLAEKPAGEREVEVRLAGAEGEINPDLTVGVNLTESEPLKSNELLSGRGITVVGKGFIVEKEAAEKFGLGKIKDLEKHIRPCRNGKDIAQHSRGNYAIDMLGLTSEQVRDRFPAVYQWLLSTVKPFRDQMRRNCRRENWWLFGEPLKALRPSFAALKRYIATVYVAKHRFFLFLDKNILPEDGLVAIALEDAASLAILSSRIHVSWTLAQGGMLESRPTYNNSRCFATFPFPDLSKERREKLNSLGGRLDALRKERLALHESLTMTDMYNVLEKLRSGAALNEKEREIYEKGLIGVLRELHEEIDREVAAAYGWPAGLKEAEILKRLLALNKERAAEEKDGKIRWLRPEFQDKGHLAAAQTGFDLPEMKAAKSGGRAAWPKTLAEQFKAVEAALAALKSRGIEANVANVCAEFARAPKKKVAEILETLASQGKF